jgi:dienelactone hydrolase
MGGALTLAYASKYPGEVDAIVPFYGIPNQTKFDLTQIKCPVLMHIGETDAAKGFSDPETAK